MIFTADSLLWIKRSKPSEINSSSLMRWVMKGSRLILPSSTNLMVSAWSFAVGDGAAHVQLFHHNAVDVDGSGVAPNGYDDDFRSRTACLDHGVQYFVDAGAFDATSTPSPLVSFFTSSTTSTSDGSRM